VGGIPVLARVIRALRAAQVDHILVVLAPGADDLSRLALAEGAAALFLPAETSEMRQTVEFGLRWLEETHHPPRDALWLLVPGDHPCMEPEVIRRLIAASLLDPRGSIFVPVHQGRRGHPTLFRWPHANEVAEIPAGRGLDHLIREQRAVTREVPVESASVLWDLDTPEDYERLQHSIG
jgi:molybdenum cofactor cytidylyltransferase